MGRLNKYSKEQLIIMLQSIGKESISKKDVDKNPNIEFGSMTIIRYFGSWNNGLKEAGLTPGLKGRPKK